MGWLASWVYIRICTNANYSLKGWLWLWPGRFINLPGSVMDEGTDAIMMFSGILFRGVAD
jgi:hypothetical protein